MTHCRPSDTRTRTHAHTRILHMLLNDICHMCAVHCSTQQVARFMSCLSCLCYFLAQPTPTRNANCRDGIRLHTAHKQSARARATASRTRPQLQLSVQLQLQLQVQCANTPEAEDHATRTGRAEATVRAAVRLPVPASAPAASRSANKPNSQELP
jgi:hypothetical protein